jgi:hypothetical protein
MKGIIGIYILLKRFLNKLFQVRKKKTDSLVGVTNETYLTPWPNEHQMQYFASYPALLKMLYLDFKSKEFVPQMMFTVGPKKKCNLFARVVN